MNPFKDSSESSHAAAPRPRNPMLVALGGERVDPPPLWLMRQAGRWLPEYRALRTEARDFPSFCLTPEMAAEATMQPLRRFPLDAAVVFSDILLLPMALGMDLTFVPGEGPLLAPPVADVAALERLDWRGFLSRLAPTSETVRRVRASAPAEVAVVGFCGAPWTVALYMLAGRGGDAGRFAARQAAWRDGDLMGELLTRLADASASWLVAQIDAGADVVQIFDSWSGEIPGTMRRPWREAPLMRLVGAVRAQRPETPIIVFLRGAEPQAAWTATLESGATALGLGVDVDLAAWHARAPQGLCVQGALDPAALVAGGEALAAATRANIEALRERPHIMNLGHGVAPHTPLEHGAQLVDAVKNWRRGDG